MDIALNQWDWGLGGFTMSAKEFSGAIGPAARRSASSTQSVLEARNQEAVAKLYEQFREARQILADAGAGKKFGALTEAETLLASIPLGDDLPEARFEEDGSIGLEWDIGPGRFFLMALDGTGRLEYSIIRGPDDETYGRIPFRGTLPALAIEALTTFQK